MRAPWHGTRLIMPVGPVDGRGRHGVWVSRMRLVRAGLSRPTLGRGRSIVWARVEGKRCHPIHYRNLRCGRSALGCHRAIIFCEGTGKLEDVSSVVVIGRVVNQALASIARLLVEMISDGRLRREEGLVVVIGLRTGEVTGNVVAVAGRRGLVKRRERTVETRWACRGSSRRSCRRRAAGWTRLVPVTSNGHPEVEVVDTHSLLPVEYSLGLSGAIDGLESEDSRTVVPIRVC